MKNEKTPAALNGEDGELQDGRALCYSILHLRFSILVLFLCDFAALR
jgi:hypothetical protein